MNAIEMRRQQARRLREQAAEKNDISLHRRADKLDAETDDLVKRISKQQSKPRK